MFAIEQIREAHAKVKTGADFPNYTQEIIRLGVKGYETYVTDGDTIYFGTNNFKTRSGSKYASIDVAEKSNQAQFQKDLKSHQQGETNFPTFCLDCAKSGIEKWKLDFEEMTCTYYDRSGNILVVESISGS
jgi:uncharacterized protein YbcV (DUF1398 family)